MKKADRQRLDAALDKALAPPRRRPQANLDALLDEYAPPEKEQAKPILHAAPATIVPQTTVVSQTPEPLSETTVVPQTTVARQTTVDPSKYTPTPNDISDKVLPTLSVYAQVVLMRLYRLSRGIQGAETCKVGYDTLARACNASKSQVIRAVKELESAKWIERVGSDLASSNKHQRGTIFRVLLPVAARTIARQTTVVPQDTVVYQTPVVSQTLNKETHIKETHTNTEGVRAGSRFSLAECRKYAESLRKDGITNPGGYATKIHRSGEADDLIAAFLEPVESAKLIDASQCPDCGGTGWYYPQGKEKGAARCKHERLRVEL